MSKHKYKEKSRGRPRSARKAREIMNSAMDLFTRNGFDGTSVDEIAEAAGVSKQTVYSHYSSKENLFGLAVAAKCRQSGVDADSIDPDVPPETMLPLLAERFFALVTSPEAVRVHAVCTASAETHPELGQLYFDHGPSHAVDAVAGYLAAQTNKGRLKVKDPRAAAWQLLGMLKAEYALQAQFNIKRSSRKKAEAYWKSCVDMFLRAYAA